MSEEWKDIPGYEGQYQASSLGRIKSLGRMIESGNQFGRFEYYSPECILRPGKSDKCGHLSVVLHGKRKKSYCVHQLVMLAFEGCPPKGKVVCHNNGNPEDNRIENLRYDTQTENVLDVYRLGRAWRSLTLEDAAQIKFGLTCGLSCRELSKMYGVCHQTISKIKKGQTYSWL